jgi:hypothetical protein
MSGPRAYLMLAFALTIGHAHIASAQEQATDLAGVHGLVRAGDTVYVTDTAGRIRRWTVRDVPLEQVIQDTGLSTSDVSHIARERADCLERCPHRIGRSGNALAHRLCGERLVLLQRVRCGESVAQHSCDDRGPRSGCRGFDRSLDPKAGHDLPIQRHTIAEYQCFTDCDRPTTDGAYFRNVLIL